ncbi:hypothetical protein B0H67DRAFT_372727 [Lasiosphaeris hirsuta]|uniref:Uncharacterized protein n=1 Tax=Lasiosphaeris hirsuta TaxID=260670 RepID=A0AA39ZWY0_9PEZI|nr:hypothetical protein B0H67DRAFT_372727 [Lasiosphaeris hirsuta]
MSNNKYFILAAVIGLGVANGYYTFNDSLKEEKQRRDGTTLSQSLQPQKSRAATQLKDHSEERNMGKSNSHQIIKAPSNPAALCLQVSGSGGNLYTAHTAHEAES